MSIKLGLPVNTKNYLVRIIKTPNLPFSSNFIFRILSLLLEGHFCPQTSSQWFWQIRCFYTIFFYYKNLLCFPYFSKTLLESRQSFQRIIKKVTELKQKRKAKCYHRQQDFRITQDLSSNSNFTQVLWPWASYSIDLQFLYFCIAQW